ncbi:MAG: pyruvate ferredoxin oxidoreductase [Deltaproteobacteria bacterium]|nr:pyruvate ferredoxin oxidoreductase [Deltaproteobacteria bacterium]
MKQQLIISGLGGQGVLTLTRLLAYAAAAQGLEVISSETHGMAQRGGAVISMVKVGPFQGPLIAAGQADVGLFLQAANLPVHGFYLKPGASVMVNTPVPGPYRALDALGVAACLGLPPVTANLILLGFAAAHNGLFCQPQALAAIIRQITPPRFVEGSLRAFQAGVEALSR